MGLVESLSAGTVIGVGSFVAQNLIPERYQFWARDRNNIGRLLAGVIIRLADEIRDDGKGNLGEHSKP